MPRTLNMQYNFEPDTLPYQLDLMGFTGPPLENKTLFGIIEFAGTNSFKFDCDVGPSNESGKKYRPAKFTKDTVTYKSDRLSSKLMQQTNLCKI